MARVIKAYGRSLATGCAIRAAATVIVFGLVGVGAVFASMLWVVGIIDTEWMGVIALLFMVGTVFTAMPVVLVGVTTWRGYKLDQAFPMPGKGVGPVTRGWAGEVDGRAFNGWFAKGPMLELYLACDSGTRVVVGRTNALGKAVAGALGTEQLELEGPLGELGLVASAAEEAWVRALLASPGVSEGIASFFEDDDGRTVQLVTINPGSVKLTLRFLPVSRITEDNVDAWIELLAVLADAIEQIDPPEKRQEESGIEAFARQNRGAVFKWVFLGMMALMALVFVPAVALIGFVIAFG